jgi:hypothetical protein
MQIGSKPEERLFIGREGGDTFLVLDFAESRLRLYKTVETLMNPSAEVIAAHADKPYFWPRNAGMMSILAEVNSCTFEGAETAEEVVEIIEDLEAALDPVY